MLDGGDWSQGTPEGALEDGRAFARALELLDYDALCIGNHEFDHGVERLARLLAEVALPAVLANFESKEGTLDPPAYRVFERVGLAIAVVGLVSEDTPHITHPSARGCTFEEPGRALTRLRKELEGDVDWILPLTHLGVDGDRALARAHPDLDLIVGGHSHTVLAEGMREGSTLIVQAGSKGSAVGRVDVWFDGGGEVLEMKAQLVDLYHDPEVRDANAVLDARINGMLERTANEMSEEVGRLEGALRRAERPLVSSTAGNFITDAVRAHTGADFALHNRGGIRTNLYAGVVTRRDVFDFAPFSNHLVVLTLSLIHI